MTKNIQNIMICPDCDSSNCYKYDIDEIDFFENGTGRYYFTCSCRNCGNVFRVYMDFEYTITKASRL